MNIHDSHGALGGRLKDAFNPSSRNHSKRSDLRLAFEVVSLLAIPAYADGVRHWLLQDGAGENELRLDMLRSILFAEFRRRLPELIGRMDDSQRLPGSMRRVLHALAVLCDVEPAIDTAAQVD